MLVQRAGLSPGVRLAVRAVATVLPFWTNSYVVDHLIDWDAAPDDPIYRLVFPQPDMLPRGRGPDGRPAQRERARSEPEPHRVDQDRDQVASVLAAALRHRPGRG